MTQLDMFDELEEGSIETAAWHLTETLMTLGHDLYDEHFVGTPERIARFWAEFSRGVPNWKFTTFTEPCATDQIVLEHHIPFYSLCAHHFVPFWGVAHVAYIPRRKKVAGLSKLARAVDHYAHMPQVQERLGTQIADLIEEELDPLGVAVILTAEHMCMTMRGVEKPGTLTTTSVMRGAFFINPAARQELMQLIYGK